MERGACLVADSILIEASLKILQQAGRTVVKHGYSNNTINTIWIRMIRKKKHIVFFLALI